MVGTPPSRTRTICPVRSNSSSLKCILHTTDVAVGGLTLRQLVNHVRYCDFFLIGLGKLQ